MPIATFSSFTDGLDRAERSRDHFITNTKLENDRLWVPCAEGVWFQPCHFNVTTGGFSVVLKGLPGSKIGTHYHVGTVHGYTLHGHWRYLEHDWIAKPGTFIYEPAGEAHTLRYHRRLARADGGPLHRWRRIDLPGQGGEWWLRCLRGRIRHPGTVSETLPASRSATSAS